MVKVGIQEVIYFQL